MTQRIKTTRRVFATGVAAAIGGAATGTWQSFGAETVHAAQVDGRSSKRTTAFLRRPDAAIYYEVTGSGPAIVFAHGAGGNHLSWWQQIPYFSPRFTCVTFSHRTFAPSTEAANGPGPAAFVEDLAALIDHLRLADVVLVAQSLGGRACLPYAIQNPSRVRALVMASTLGGVDYSTIRHPEVGREAVWAREAERTQAQMKQDGVIPGGGIRMAKEQPALLYLYSQINDLTDVARKQARAATQASVPPPSIEAVKQLSAPVLFITGAEDAAIFPGASVALASIMRNARVESVPRAAHSVYFQRPDTFNRLVDSFLRSLKIE